MQRSNQPEPAHLRNVTPECSSPQLFWMGHFHCAGELSLRYCCTLSSEAHSFTAVTPCSTVVSRASMPPQPVPSGLVLAPAPVEK